MKMRRPATSTSGWCVADSAVFGRIYTADFQIHRYMDLSYRSNNAALYYTTPSDPHTGDPGTLLAFARLPIRSRT